MEGVLDVGVIGVPSEREGELPKAYVVKTRDSSITQQVKSINDFSFLARAVDLIPVDPELDPISIIFL